MFKPLLQAMLAFLLELPAVAELDFPDRKLYPDPRRTGTLIDSSQIKLLQLRHDFTKRDLARIKDSKKTLQKNILPHHQTTTLTSTLPYSHTPILSDSHTPILSNTCGTKASFTPGNDTTLYTGQAISFTNTSLNADSYEWFNDVYNRTTTTDFANFVPAVGVTQIMLVAHRGTCTDTAVTYVVNNGTPPVDPRRMITTYGLPVSNEWASCIISAKTDGYLLAGTSGDDKYSYTSPYFVRASETGCLRWSRILPPGYQKNVNSVITTYDSGFIAHIGNNDPSDGSDLVKIDKNGNIVWARTYHNSNEENWMGTIREMSDHSLMILSARSYGRSFLLTGLDELGSFRWQKKYGIGSQDFAWFTDLVEQNGSAWVVGIYDQTIPGSNPNNFAMLFKVDVTTGNPQWIKGYVSPNKELYTSGIHFYKGGLLMNAFADSVLANNINPSYFETLLETDLDGNIREGKLIYTETEINGPYNDNLFINPDNSLSIFYSGSEDLYPLPRFNEHGYFLRLDADGNILWQNQYTGNGVGPLMQASPAPSKGLAMLGNRMNSLLNPFYGVSENLVLVKVDSNGKGPDPFCDVYETYSTIQDMSVLPASPGNFTVTDEILQVTDQPRTVTNPNSELRYNCPDYVPLCSFMKLSGENFICNLRDTLEFIAHKDPSCLDPVKWTYDVSNIKTVYEDGSRSRLLFKTAGIYKIKAEKPFPCSPITDSIIVTVAPTLINFNLGGDTTLCTGDSITLRPQGKYDQYLWQDGSASESFQVKSAGLYFCMVTDSCRNTKADTIQIDFRSSIPVDLGTPRLKCASDSLTIVPPPGFKQYDWTPDYNMIPSSGGTVILYPSKDTSYQLTVHDNGGCAGTAQLKINVFPESSVTIGNDTAVCTGAHVLFSVGGNFQSYAWSNGSSAASIDVWEAGKYHLQVMDQNNCKSSDTVELTVYPSPDLHIKGGTALCRNQDLVLDAGAGFTDYRWQDGSQLQRFTVPDTGFYRVQVTDAHHCIAADSIHITAYAETPHRFLPPDTAVCLYQGGTIEPKGDFAEYNWSTGETARSILVKTSGLYMLQVVDLHGCIGMDSINITTKDCEALLVFPNAFTPNHDGLNDVFRLKYPGLVAAYQLQIFNRWGQMIYSTSDPYGEWDGRFSNELQPAGTYVWIARFTDRSGKKQNLQGSVVLIR